MNKLNKDWLIMFVELDQQQYKKAENCGKYKYLYQVGEATENS